MARVHDLETKRQNGIHLVDLIHRDEEARRLRLRILYARDENSLLKGRISQQDIRHRHLSKQSDKVRAQLDGTKATIHTQDARLKKQTIEIANLKVGRTGPCLSISVVLMVYAGRG
jgi:hypothetical protein